MLKTVAASRAAERMAAETDGALSPQERYFRDQAEAVYRVHAPFHPGKHIRVVLRALDHVAGDPGSVSVIAGRAGRDVVDDAYAGYMDFDDPALETAAGEDADETETTVTVIAGIPRMIRPDETFPEKTSPDFSHQPALQRLLWASPVMFEQLKYHYERRDRKLCASRHSFNPIRRATTQPLGRLAEPRDTTRPPAILIGFHWLEMGGAEKLAFDCVTWARQAGFRVLVVAERAEIHRHAGKLPEDPDVEFIRADAYLQPDQWFPFLENLIRAENVRAIHIHHNTRLYDNLMLLKATFPDLVVIDSTHIVEYSNGGFPRTSGVWTNYIDHHHVISRELVSFYLDRFSVSERVVLGRMLDPEAAGDALPELRLKAGQTSLRLAFVGRMVHQKRAPLVVAIIRKLQKALHGQGVKLGVDMVGTGPYLDVVRHMIRRANLGSVITLHPADSDVPALLGKADILLLPSSNEGLALVCYEAIGAGALPVSTDVGGQGELVADDLLVPSAPLLCIRETVARIQRLLNEPAFLDRCKSETLERYRNLRADPTAQEVLSGLYSDIVKGSVST